ncbi:MAG: EscU/YscU/HrcU family type III secretion system export apparatus switch protein [Blastomonas sp.]
MAETDQAQDKSEEPTDHKLRKAREKGTVARGIDLPFVVVLATLGGMLIALAPAFGIEFAKRTRRVIIGAGPDNADFIWLALDYLGWPAVRAVLTVGLILVPLVALIQLVQLRGFIFATHPLKPDFGRLNPAKGLKRLFSMRLLKETLKTIVKFLLYSAILIAVIRWASDSFLATIDDGHDLSLAMMSAALRLLFAFLAASIFFAIIDQIIARGEFRKQMRMTPREVRREHKDREGDPRIKQERKKLHGSLARQQTDSAGLGGADMLIVNPTHYAIGLKYRPNEMTSPVVVAKGRNMFASRLRSNAAVNGVTIIHDPKLARALYKSADRGSPIPQSLYGRVADIYFRLIKSGALKLEIV